MAKRNHSFDVSESGDDWGEYKKTTKKKVKHRENESGWRFDKRQDYKVEDNYDEDERKIGW
ncbi:hypothetical protein UFOVP49_98 [uncultured Caudovirales phage]|uniref:Uncharacterized protein n=1 Tax=uncultured Caudovirales phage TaxID=2100421 RepID=A0A6J5KVM2_9CAUD|nr:hypothetical protein UFOVP49_98 [uncultured Caudovirales phage]